MTAFDGRSLCDVTHSIAKLSQKGRIPMEVTNMCRNICDLAAKRVIDPSLQLSPKVHITSQYMSRTVSDW